MGPIRRYRSFWPSYLAEHRKPLTRQLHFAGTLGALVLVGLAAGPGPAWLGALAPICGYGLAWAGHAFVEKNRPATFRRPLFSLIGDIHMVALMLAGRMAAEVAHLSADAEKGA